MSLDILVIDSSEVIIPLHRYRYSRIQTNLFVRIAWKNRPEFVVGSFGEIVSNNLTVIKKNVDFDQAVQIQNIVFEDFVVKLLLICMQFF